jgi:hypothetical protein
MIPTRRTGTDLELDLKWRIRGDAVRVWCLARAVESLLCDFPSVAVASAATGHGVIGFVAVGYDPIAGVHCGNGGGRV